MSTNFNDIVSKFLQVMEARGNDQGKVSGPGVNMRDRLHTPP